MPKKQMAVPDEQTPPLTMREIAQITAGTLFFLLMFLGVGFLIALGPAQ